MPNVTAKIIMFTAEDKRQMITVRKTKSLLVVGLSTKTEHYQTQ